MKKALRVLKVLSMIGVLLAAFYTCSSVVEYYAEVNYEGTKSTLEVIITGLVVVLIFSVTVLLLQNEE